MPGEPVKTIITNMYLDSDGLPVKGNYYEVKKGKNILIQKCTYKYKTIDYDESIFSLKGIRMIK